MKNILTKYAQWKFIFSFDNCFLVWPPEPHLCLVLRTTMFVIVQSRWRRMPDAVTIVVLTRVFARRIQICQWADLRLRHDIFSNSRACPCRCPWPSPLLTTHITPWPTSVRWFIRIPYHVCARGQPSQPNTGRCELAFRWRETICSGPSLFCAFLHLGIKMYCYFDNDFYFVATFWVWAICFIALYL